MMHTYNYFSVISAAFMAICTGFVILNFRIIKPHNWRFDYDNAIICKPSFEVLMIMLCYLFGRVIQGSSSFSDRTLVNRIIRIFTTPDLYASF